MNKPPRRGSGCPFCAVSDLRLFAAFQSFLALVAIAFVCCCPTVTVASSQEGDALGPETTVPAPADSGLSNTGFREDDVWVVSTRRLPDISRLPTHVTFDVERLVPDVACSRWMPSDLPSLLEEPQRPLVIFIHGNRYEPHDAKAQGIMLARRLAACGSSAAAPRTVVFSWPSEQQGRLIASSRENYRRSYADGH